ncbi:MAG: SurA N-terminal domain-containing protein [Candidatus Binatus sp.]|uniref:peptidylprolyl isomerase n=1 Tax=Candidatus Binatus sp. TaxID=2811406 RepID=UPI002717BA29|nr:peptidylprolyl isomerase [Candidatus Binatus sp.]MDO8432258.1 SurA N-terminal domain-containing protein [Candidatus Binatus sp.]
MLEVMRRHAYSWGTRIVLGGLAVIFAFWGIGSGFFAQVKPVANVNGQRILSDQVDREASRLRDTLGQMYGADAPAVLKSINLRQAALDQLIERQLITEQARHLGLSITNEALQQKIATTKSFQRDGQFDLDTYQEVLRSNNLFPHEYEASERVVMLQETLRNMIEAGIQVSDDEVRHAFNLKNEKIGLRYFEIPFADFTAKIAPTEQQIADYYKKNIEQFREPARARIIFIHYAPLVLAATYAPSDKDVDDYYKRNLKTQFTHPDQVHARHILIEVAEGATEAEKAKAKLAAMDVLKQAQAGGDFKKLAAKYSEDHSTKIEGGDLGTFGRGQMIKPFEDAVFAMKPGQIVFVETRFGYHVVKLDESKPAHTDTIAEARPKVIDALRTQAGAKLGREALDSDLTAALGGASLPDLAKKRGIEAVETPLFAANDRIIGAEQDHELGPAAFKLEVGEVRAVPVKGAPYLIKLLEKRPSRIPPLKEIEAQVRDALIRATAIADAHNQAQKIIATIKTLAAFDKAATDNKLAIKTVDPFPRTEHSIPGIGQFPEVTDAAGVLPTIPGVIDRVMENRGNSYIFEVASRTEPTDEQWKSAQKSFTQEFLDQRRAQAWTQFLDHLKDQAKIKIDSEQLGSSEQSM